jgi:hypothetical protein
VSLDHRRIAAPVGAEIGEAAAPVIERHDGPWLGRVVGEESAKRSEVPGIARQSRKAEEGQAFGATRFVDARGEPGTILGGEPRDAPAEGFRLSGRWRLRITEHPETFVERLSALWSTTRQVVRQ